MLKYTDTQVVFQEIPDEITLAINISNCPCNCEGCHSAYLAEDIGEPLHIARLSQLVAYNQGITCVCFMGGDSEPFEINLLAKAVKDNTNLKTAWYSGRQELAEEVNLKNFDYVKLGPYIEELGPLNNPNTNQILYRIECNKGVFNLTNITHKFWKNDSENSLQ